MCRCLVRGPLRPTTPLKVRTIPPESGTDLRTCRTRTSPPRSGGDVGVRGRCYAATAWRSTLSRASAGAQRRPICARASCSISNSICGVGHGGTGIPAASASATQRCRSPTSDGSLLVRTFLLTPPHGLDVDLRNVPSIAPSGAGDLTDGQVSTCAQPRPPQVRKPATATSDVCLAAARYGLSVPCCSDRVPVPNGTAASRWWSCS